MQLVFNGKVLADNKTIEECGIGNNYGVLDTVLNTTFNLTYFPYIQGEGTVEDPSDNQLCME